MEQSQLILNVIETESEIWPPFKSVGITRFLAYKTFSRNSCVFWYVLKLQSLMVFMFELHGFEWFYGYMSQMQSAQS